MRASANGAAVLDCKRFACIIRSSTQDFTAIVRSPPCRPAMLEKVMAEAATSEFWRDIKPIKDVFKPDSLGDAYMSKIAEGDERYWVPITDTVSSKPVWISPQRNMWADILLATEPGLVNRHYHPHPIWAYTVSGKWGYLEHDWTATAGDFIYESPGEGHTLVSYEHADPMKVFFVVTGPLIWLDDHGQAAGYYDVHDYIAAARAHYDKVGIGAAYVDKLFR